MKTTTFLATAIAMLFTAATSLATVITFDAVTPTGFTGAPIVTDGFTFDTTDGGANHDVSNTAPFLPPGTYNGTPYWHFGFASGTFGQTGGGAFLLNSIDLGISWYINDATRVVAVTLVNGMSSTVVNLTLDHSFQTFSFNSYVTSVIIQGQGDGYVSVDNVALNQSVPDGGSTIALLGLAMTAAAGMRRKFGI